MYMAYPLGLPGPACMHMQSRQKQQKMAGGGSGPSVLSSVGLDKDKSPARVLAPTAGSISDKLDSAGHLVKHGNLASLVACSTK